MYVIWNTTFVAAGTRDEEPHLEFAIKSNKRNEINEAKEAPRSSRVDDMSLGPLPHCS